MDTCTVSEFRKDLYNLVDSLNETHEPLQVVGKRNSIVVLAEDDFKAMQETMYLLSIPNMRESILEAHKEPLKHCKTKLAW